MFLAGAAIKNVIFLKNAFRALDVASFNSRCSLHGIGKRLEKGFCGVVIVFTLRLHVHVNSGVGGKWLKEMFGQLRAVCSNNRRVKIGFHDKKSAAADIYGSLR